MKACDQGLFACGVYLDLKKAFDTVNHNILLSKLHHYGIRGKANDWFKSFLVNRNQYTSINNTNSTSEKVMYAVMYVFGKCQREKQNHCITSALFCRHDFFCHFKSSKLSK